MIILKKLKAVYLNYIKEGSNYSPRHKKRLLRRQQELMVRQLAKRQIQELMGEELKKNFQDKKTDLYESVLVKDLQRELHTVHQHYHLKEACDAPSNKEHSHTKAFILTRVLGHDEIINSKPWRISNECYMCDRHNYTLVFWNKQTGT